MTKTCVTYLDFDVFESGACGTIEGLMFRMSRFKFLRYAAEYWNFHCKGPAQDYPEVLKGIIRICTSKNQKKSMLQVDENLVISLSWGSLRWLRHKTQLHIIVDKGLAILCSQILEMRGDKSERCLFKVTWTNFVVYSIDRYWRRRETWQSRTTMDVPPCI